MMAKKKLGAVEPMEAVVSAQELDGREKALVDEVYARLEVFRQGCSEMHDRSKDARDIILLQDPEQDVVTVDATGLIETESASSTLQLQTLKSTFNNCVADQMDNMPEAIMLPERADLQQQADDLTDLVRFVLMQNNWESVHRRRVEDFLGTGTAVVQVAWDPTMDYGKGGIAVLRWPVESFLWDPRAENIQDSRAVMKVSWHPLSWYAGHYPDKAANISSEDDLWDVGVPTSQETSVSADEPRAMLIEYWYRLYDAKKKRYSINVAYLAGGALLEVAENVYDHGMYPFIIDAYSTIEGMPVGDGMIQELVPMMRYINRYMKYIDTNLRMSSKGRMLINRNAGIDKAGLADWSQDIIEADRVDPEAMQWLQHAPFTGMITQMMLQMQTDLKMDSGQNQFTRGETAGGVTAASAISALQEAGSKITRLRTAVLNHGFKQIVEQILWLMAQFYTKEKVLMITGRQEQQREVRFSSEYLFGKRTATEPPPYTVQIQIQRRNPLRVQAQNELYIQAYSMAAQAQQVFPLKVLFELLNVDGKDKIMPILEQVDIATQQMQQMSQAVQQLQQENEGLKQGLANLQGLNQKLSGAMRGKMYAQGGVESEALPEVKGQMAM
jgi:hypothetical protein